MLDKNDLKAIGELIDKKVINAIGAFFVDTLAPFLDGKFKNIEERLDAHENDLDTLLRKSDKNDDDHDEIFRRLDKNDKEHGKIYQKLEDIDEKVSDHGKRIKKLETTLAS